MSVGPILEKCRAENRPALVGYLPVGFPTVEGSIAAMKVLVDSGVDIIEIGVPYSDPVMDGPVIQDAAVRALAGGVRLADIFTATREVSGLGAGALVMTYWNPVLRYGVERFATDLAAAGGAGLITPDLIPDEASGPSSRATCWAPASACELSMAAMMPSVRVSKAIASIASASLIGRYDARPLSCSHACSGPTPG